MFLLRTLQSPTLYALAILYITHPSAMTPHPACTFSLFLPREAVSLPCLLSPEAQRCWRGDVSKPEKAHTWVPGV